ncbi:histidine-rich carboxyl terminus protein 1 [Puntigrus tetrazona]|uniref:histidine-rich carboxyl terminus protein 1 n=1 Tax=Puntigrus tetrazona TaxID=1606681 RepID=UPI001C8A8E87|nr:histidine-rich carboxyl terminus protein 1 [Puntigrus tetrazona]XP_043081034.1 histidine-rich carboxyl terminus protein 1 [Puntigrus tetrazona]
MPLIRAFAFLCLLISVGAQRSYRLTCYPDVLTQCTREGPCSHIILPLTSIDDDLYLQSLSENDSDTLRKMKERNPALKILLGLEVKSSRLELMSANEAGVETFVQTVLTYLKDKSLDGLDVTWLDGPSSDESSRSTELFTNLMKSLKGAFEKETQPVLLSVSVLEPVEHSAVTYEQTLSQYVDFISVLPADLDKDELHINKTVQHWQDQQVDLQKLNLAMPAFQRRSRRRHRHRDHLKHDDMNTETGRKDHIHVLGLYMGEWVCQAIKSGQEQFITLTSLSNEQSLVEEVLRKGFGGIGVVFIDVDVFYNSTCASITQEERSMVESKVIVHSHHDHRRREHGGHHHRRSHHHSHHGHHHSHLPNRSHGHHHHEHHHGHRHHGHRRQHQHHK